MKNRPLNKLMRKIIWNNKGKIFIISFVLSLAITIFTAFGFSNTFLQHNVDVLQKNYKSFDFIFNNEKSFSKDKLDSLAKKYDFKYEQKEVTELETTAKINGKKPIVHFDNNDSFGIKYIISTDQMNDKISKPYIIDGRWLKNDNEIVVLPQVLNTLKIKIGDNLNLQGKVFKIVGSYSTPQYQKNISTSLTDRDSYVMPVQMTKNGYDKINGDKKIYNYAFFNSKISLNQRKAIYEKMKNEKDFVKKVAFPTYKNVKKDLKYDKHKVCGSPELIEQYASNPELTVQQFNRVAAMILQAQAGGNCRSTLGDKSLATKDSNSLDAINSLTQASSSADSINTNVNDLTPHYKQPKVVSYTPRSYSYSPQLIKFAEQIAAAVNDTAKYYDLKTTAESKDKNLFSGMSNFVLLYEKYTNANGVLKAAENGETKIKFDYTFVQDGKREHFAKMLEQINRGLGTNQTHDTEWDISPLTSAIAQDKSRFNQEEQQRKGKIEQFNQTQNQQIQAWNKQEDLRVAKLKEEKAKLNSSQFKDKQEQLKKQLQEQKEKAKAEDAKLGIVTKSFHIKTFDKNIYKDMKLLSTIQDFEEIPTSKGIVEQMNKQTLISTLLFVIFSLLSALLIVIILQKIINDNKSEFGTLKALGIRERQISSKFLMIPIITVLASVVMSFFLVEFAYQAIVNFLNSTYYLPVSKYFELNMVVIVASIIIPAAILVIYTKVSTKSLLGMKTLNLLNDIKDNHTQKGPKWLQNAATTVKLQYKTIRYNKDKSLIVFSSGLIITFLLSLVSFMYFSSSQTYGYVGKDLSYSTINIKKKAENNVSNTPNQILFEAFNIKNVYDSKYNQKSFEGYDKKVDSGNTLDLNVIGVQQLKAKSYDISQLNEEKVNKGLMLPNKYHVLYGINEGDLLQTEYNGQTLYLRVSGFQNADENVFVFTSSAYLASVTNQMGKINGEISNAVTIVLTPEDKFSIDKVLATKAINSVQQRIISLIVLVAIIILIIITPLIFILVANIIDSNIKTIATLKAIGFRLGQIRSLTINPYLPIFIVGQLLGILLVWGYFGKQIINIFFGYFGFDVILHISWNTTLIILIVILVAYQFIITLSSQRINIVKTARILNEDSGQVRISNQDVQQYFKASTRSLLDYEKPEFRFSWKDITPLSKKERKTLWKKYIVKYLPKYLAGLTASWVDVGMSGLNLFVETVMLPIRQVTMGVSEVTSSIGQINVINILTTAANNFKLQFAKQGNKDGYQDSLKIIIMSRFLFEIFQLTLFMLLGDLISFAVDLSETQRQLLYLMTLTAFIGNSSNLILFKFENFIDFMETKPSFIIANLSKLQTLSNVLIPFLFYKWILVHYITYSIIMLLVQVGINIFLFGLFTIIFRKNKYYEFINVPILDMLLIKDWGIFKDIVKQSLPQVYAAIIKMPLNLIVGIVIGRLLNQLYLEDRNFVLIKNINGFINTLFLSYWPVGIQAFIFSSVTRMLGVGKFAKSLQRAKDLKIWVFFGQMLPNYIKLIIHAVLIFIFPIHGLALQMTLLEFVVQPLNIYLSGLIIWYTQLLYSGSEFKFTSYVGVLVDSVLMNMFTAIFGILNISQFQMVGSLISSIVQVLIYKKRVSNGRWLYSVVSKKSVSNVPEEYERLKAIQRSKSNKYTYKYDDRTLNIPEDYSI